MTTRQRTGRLATALLVGALALGACGGQRTATEDVEQDQVQSAEVRPAAAQQSAASTAHRLRQVRALHPTAGLEVPPAALTSTPPATGQVAVTGGLTPLTEPSRTRRHAE